MEASYSETTMAAGSSPTAQNACRGIALRRYARAIRQRMRSRSRFSVSHLPAKGVNNVPRSAIGSALRTRDSKLAGPSGAPACVGAAAPEGSPGCSAVSPSPVTPVDSDSPAPARGCARADPASVAADELALVGPALGEAAIDLAADPAADPASDLASDLASDPAMTTRIAHDRGSTSRRASSFPRIRRTI